MLPKSGFSVSWIFASPAPSMPPSSSAERTSSTLAGWASAASIRVPDSKSIPRLSCLVAKAIAPIARITPEIEKKYFEAPVKSNFHCRPSPLAPRNDGERMRFERPSSPMIACVNSTAVNRETMVPMPSVKAKPLTPAVARPKRMNAVNRMITFASTIVAIPLR